MNYQPRFATEAEAFKTCFSGIASFLGRPNAATVLFSGIPLGPNAVTFEEVELIAYLNLAALPAGTLDPRSTLIMVYAMCGFANLGSVGIMIAGMSTLMPGRRDEIVGSFRTGPGEYCGTRHRPSDRYRQT